MLETPVINTDEVCFHCGTICDSETITSEDKSFCCFGCKSVYEILSQNGLSNYYCIEKNPGKRVNKIKREEWLSILDNREIKENYIVFSNASTEKVLLTIPTIHCSSCIWILENLSKLNPCILSSQVNFITKQVTITYKSCDLSLRRIVELLFSIGYEPDISFSDSKTSKVKKNNSLSYRLALAGFCFGNSMLLSFPEYLSSEPIERDFKLMFNYLNLILAIPVTIYSASDYHISAFKALRQRIININLPIAIGILALFLKSAYDILSQTGPGYMDSLTGLVFFLLIGRWFQSKTYESLSFERDYKSYFPVAVSKKMVDGEKYVQLKDIMLGDRIYIRNGQLVPADSQLLSKMATIDYSYVTGESDLVHVTEGEQIYAGGRHTGGAIELEVLKPVSQSYLTSLWNQDIFKKEKEADSKTILDLVSKRFTIAILSISLMALVIWFLIDSSVAINAFTSVLIIACPCALALTLPFAYGHSIRLLGKNGFYLKNADVVGVLPEINTIVFDKTGTITLNNSFSVDFVGESLNSNELRLVESLVNHSTHPLSKAIYGAIQGNALFEVLNFQEIPAQGITGVVDGNELKIGSDCFTGGFKEHSDMLASYVFVQINGKCRGYFNVMKHYRSGLKNTVDSLSGYDLHLLSGDNDSERSVMTQLFKNKTNIHFRQSPQDKLNYIEKLQESGKKVMMIGDGLNDSGALKQSDFGIVISDTIFNFTPASDAILQADKLEHVKSILTFSKSVKQIIYASFFISICYNGVGLFYAVTGQLEPVIAAILMPLSSVTVVGFITGMVYWRFGRVFRGKK